MVRSGGFRSERSEVGFAQLVFEFEIEPLIRK